MEKERKEVGLLLGKKQVVLTTRFLGIKIRWKLGKMTLRRLAKMTYIYTQMQVDEEGLTSKEPADQLSSQFDAINKNARKASKVIALAVSSILPTWILTRHFYRNVDSAELQHLVMTILKESNFANFTTSIFLMNGSRISRPKKVEEKSQA